MNNKTRKDGLPDPKTYETSYFYFKKSLDMLTKDAISQCVEMDYLNVAWFLKDDYLARTNVLLNDPNVTFSADRLRDICILTSLVGSVPCAILSMPNNKEDQRLAMEDSCWGPIRKRAGMLILAMADETKRVDAILWPEPEN